MSTTAQVLANRINSALSTGPKTDDGKAASSRNATSHGLSAADPVLPHEDSNEFNALLERYKSENSPATAHEEFLVAQMAGARWKLDRVERIENLLFANLVDPSGGLSTPEAIIAQAMLQKDLGAGVARLDRYRANLERTYFRCARELRAAKKLQNEPKPDTDPPAATIKKRPTIVPIQNEPNLAPDCERQAQTRTTSCSRLPTPDSLSPTSQPAP
jgi:hypothetical protein